MGDEAIGVVAGEVRGTLGASLRAGWLTFTIDTPWDAITFDVRGSSETRLATRTSSVP